MKKILSVAVITALGLGSSVAMARSYGDVARVLSSAPVLERVAVPAQQCWTQPGHRYVQHCRTVTRYQDRVIGYDVRYAYHGRHYVTRMAQAPGRTIPVNVAMLVRPVAPVAVVRGPAIPRY